MLWTFALLRWVWKVTSAHKVILLLLVSSVFMNGLYTSQEAYEWWHDRNAEKFMARLGVHPDQVMSKAIYMRDIDDALANTTIGQNSNNASECFATFHQQTLGGEGASRSLGTSSPKDSMTKSAARRLQQTRERLALYRHNLLVALRVVNSIEKEVIENEWERWLRQELRRCRQVEVLLGKSKAGDEADLQADRMGQTIFAGLSGDVRQWYDQYCTSCQREQEQLIGDQRISEVS
ncbi:SNF1-interacting protein [Aspergillus melleus]|uniref:SNF1-interacting protein n=1 Tax=Aspergillus melleus TaxID=138277 RepID=UPI001E8DFECD|nr:SNF1-interacting protein [Aspergillus melleus]KAH8422690.1 SNF1-interacting protein [Aspergillus melleus]